MERVEQTALGDQLPIEDLQYLFERKQMSLAICFGPYARDQTHSGSDIDLAVEFTDKRPGDDSYNDVLFEVYEAVSEVLGTDEVDLLDIHSLPGSLTRTVLSDGILVYGDMNRVETLREHHSKKDRQQQSPQERLDNAIERINEHLA